MINVTELLLSETPSQSGDMLVTFLFDLKGSNTLLPILG